MVAADAKRRGLGLSVVDGLIAATALTHDLTLLTRNVADFSGLGVTILNPWEA
jgi:predicted nucleic acid-binding protein